MNCNGTDRDVALELVTALDTCKTLVESINDTLYAPHITTQPTDQEVAIGETATLAVVANNVKSYQWQYLSGQTWTDSGITGSTSATFTFLASANRYHSYRCKITGLDNSVIYSNVVAVTQPEAEG